MEKQPIIEMRNFRKTSESGKNRNQTRDVCGKDINKQCYVQASPVKKNLKSYSH